MTIGMNKVIFPEPSEQDVELARSASCILRAHAEQLGLTDGAEGHLRVQVDADGDLVELPTMVTRLLQTVLEYVAAEHALSIMPLSAELTTQQAADLLGVSRPFLVKLLEAGDIEHCKVGRHRRVRVADLLNYRKQNQVKRAESLSELTSLGQAMGDYE